MSPRLLVLLLAGLLAACGGPALYQPLDDEVGYGEQKLEANRYRVWFAGNSRTPRETVEDYVLYRAAEVTLAQGYDYFVLAQKNTDLERGGPASNISLGIGGFRFGSNGGISIGIGSGAPLDGGGKYFGSADVVLAKGKKPAKDPDAFDARELKANLEPFVQRPAAPR